MNTVKLKRESGGGFKRIQGRQSIHNHPDCIFVESERNMAIYGWRNHTGDSNENLSSDDEQGADEVDSNIISKPANPIRPPPRQKNDYRRNSLVTSNLNRSDTTTCDNNALSKSVPTTLPSQLNYSTSDDEERFMETRLSDLSLNSYSTPNRSNTSRNGIQAAQKFETARYSERKLERDEQSVSKSKCQIYLIVAVVVLCGAVFSSGFSIGHMSNVNKYSYDKSRFYTDISSIGEKYSVDDDSILQVQAGISTIFEKRDTGSFIFLYNSEAQNFNLREFNCFINDISLAAAKYLRNDSTPHHYTTVDGSKLDMKEHSELVCRYRVDLATTGVMMVRHLEAVPADLAMAFHYYCDEFNPLVKKSAIFFTLNVAKCPKGPDKKTPHALIERCLSEKWRDVSVDSMGPLLSRVVSVVIDVTSVF